MTSEELGLWLYTAITAILPYLVATYVAGTFARDAYESVLERVDAWSRLLGMIPQTTRTNELQDLRKLRQHAQSV